jgi:nitrogen fixation NifU-like protein
MTEAARGKTITQAHELFKRFHTMLTGEDENTAPLENKLTVLAGVKAYPARVKCATLAWHTLESALKQEMVTVSTE